MHYPEETIKNFFSLIVYANESHSVSGLLMLPSLIVYYYDLGRPAPKYHTSISWKKHTGFPVYTLGATVGSIRSVLSVG